MIQLDPSLFSATAISPETAAFNDQLAAALAGAPPTSSQQPAAVREAREAGGGAFGPLVLSDMAVDREIPGPGGAIRLRTFVPKTVKGVYLYIHGGGWVLGRAHHSDIPLETLSNAANLAVISIEYRLAPEDPYPAGPDDCEAAAMWLVRNARTEFGSDRLVIGGDSAGAHLAAVTLLRLRDKHQISPFSGAALNFGVYDLTMTPSSASSTTGLLVPASTMKWFIDYFVPAEKRRDPDVSPLFANLAKLPSALFTVGTLDPLLDDTLFMYSRWAAAGNAAELAVYPGGIHGFVNQPIDIGQRATQRIHQFLAGAVA